jgi:putative salt-induced outer membrane protein
MIMHKKLCFGLAISLCLQGAMAQDNTWKGEGELGFTQTGGNTENQSLTAKLTLGYDLAPWEHNLKLSTFRAEDRDNLTAENYGLDLQSNYDLSAFRSDIPGYLFGKLRYNKERFSGYDYQSSLIFGYGYEVFKTKLRDLKLEAGVGIGQNSMELSVYDESNDQQAIGFLGLNFRQQIGSHSEFTQDLKLEGGTENIYSESNTGFKVSVMDNLALKLSLTIKNNSDVPPDVEKTDTISSVTMVYSF